MNTNVAGESPAAENYMNDVLDLATRLMPFSLDANLQYYSNVNPTTFFVTFRGRDYNDLNQYVQNKAKEIVADAAIYSTDYEKLRYINNYIVDNCEYVSAAVKDPDRYHKAFTTFGCLIEGQAVCEGYANSVQLLCEMLDIPCIKVTVLPTAVIISGMRFIWMGNGGCWTSPSMTPSASRITATAGLTFY